MNLPLIIQHDKGLYPFQKKILRRIEKSVLKELEFTGRSADLKEVVNGYLFYGLHKHPDGWVVREWAPNATEIYLIGDFSYWQPMPEYRFQSIGNGNWEIKVPLSTLSHLSLYKLLVKWKGGEGERIPSYCQRVVQDEATKIFSAQVWSPPKPYVWKNEAPPKVEYPLIYETHIGMSGEGYGVATFNEFRKQRLPYIAKQGYNTIQLMAIQEHPYYGSFGYQVSNFYAVSSRFGTPDELKALIDDAHKLGIAVVMDIVHSHSVKNENEGLSKFDGTEDLYFQKGDHPVWSSRCFDYGKSEVVNFLLSNCKYWLDEFHFDGFRFDGVTSMLYYDHGIGRNYTSYKMYYDGNQDEDALVYLTLANRLVHQINPNAITIAEDISGMPGLASPIESGGVGFDFRMSMGIADYWVKMLKDRHDEDWSVGDMFYELTNKRADEKAISYVESHDQAMVGDKTLIFRMIDSEMYTSMNVFERTLKVDRGMALHKIIRLATISTAGEGYLNFMGNEFGHPEWIDFPREGNNWSYQYARRQWNLVKDPNLRYRFLAVFDKAMIKLTRTEQFFRFLPIAVVCNNGDQVLVFKRGNLLFVFNFNPVHSFTDYGFEADGGTYEMILSSDATQFDGFARVNEKQAYSTINQNGAHWLYLYIPSRCAFVLKRKLKI